MLTEGAYQVGAARDRELLPCALLVGPQGVNVGVGSSVKLVGGRLASTLAVNQLNNLVAQVKRVHCPSPDEFYSDSSMDLAGWEGVSFVRLADG